MHTERWLSLRAAAVLLGTWARRDFRIRFSQTLLGGVWAVAQPAGVTIGFVFLLRQLDTATVTGVPSASFVFPGMLCWLLFASGVSGAVAGVTGSMQIMAKAKFPRIVAPVSGALLPLVDLALAALFLPVLLIAQGSGHRPHLLGLLTAIVGTVALSVGTGAFLGALAVFVRDLRNALPFLLQLLLLASSVLYPASRLPGALRWNPMVSYISLFRSAVTHTPPPGAAEMVRALVISGAILVAGVLYFRSVEDRFADVA